MGARNYSETTIKRLWALSGNQCYLPECKTPLAFIEEEHVLGEIAHIRAASPKGCRYDAVMTDDARRGFNNLLLMCPTHHRLIDHVSCDRWTTAELERVKLEHERANHPTSLPAEMLGWAARGSLDLLLMYEGTLTEEDGSFSKRVGGMPSFPRRRAGGFSDAFDDAFQKGSYARGTVVEPDRDEDISQLVADAAGDDGLEHGGPFEDFGAADEPDDDDEYARQHGRLGVNGPDDDAFEQAVSQRSDELRGK